MTVRGRNRRVLTSISHDLPPCRFDIVQSILLRGQLHAAPEVGISIVTDEEWEEAMMTVPNIQPTICAFFADVGKGMGLLQLAKVPEGFGDGRRADDALVAKKMNVRPREATSVSRYNV